jgi:flagellar motility protein MotE (MotC chaperone)
MTKILTSSWMTLPVSAIVYLAATFAFWKTPVAPVDNDAANPASGAQAASFWEFKNPEADQLIGELKTEKKSLDKREQDLNDLAVRLDAERSEISLVTQKVQQMQAEFDKNVLRVQDEETANLKKLAKVYSAMTPDSAANILADLDDTSVAKILVFMKEADTAAVLDAFAKKGAPEAKRAAGLSERLRLAAFRNNAAK